MASRYTQSPSSDRRPSLPPIIPHFPALKFTLSIVLPLLFAVFLSDFTVCQVGAQTCSGDAVVRTRDGFIAVRNEREMLCHLDAKNLDPINEVWASEAYRFVEQLAIWAASLFPAEGSTTPKIMFAYYPALRGEFGTCERNTVGRYARGSGAGAPMCQLLEATSSLGAGQLTDYLVQLLDVGKTQDSNGDPQEFFSSVNDITSLVRGLGFEPYQRFVHDFNTRFVYDPTDNEFGYMTPKTIQQLSAAYYGLSGGGGSGAGFGITCQYPNGTSEVIIRGGGGGGAGASAPGGIDQPLEAGGGGSGGVTTGTSPDGIIRVDPITKLPEFAPQVYAVADLSPFGKVTTYTDPEKPFDMSMKASTDSIRRCSARGGNVWINGGGGGGAGYEWFTQPPGQGDASKTALNLGYGFQFAVGNGNKLSKHGFPKLPLSVIVCPFLRRSALRNKVDWEQCYSEKDEDERESSATAQTEAPSSSPTTSQLYNCLGQVIPQICGKATYYDTQMQKTVSYTKYGNYVGCNCPLSNWYKEAYGTDFDRIYEPQCKGPKPSSPRYVPVLTKEAFDIRWCDKVDWKGCPILKECMSRSPTLQPSAAPTVRPTTVSPTTLRPTTKRPTRL